MSSAKEYREKLLTSFQQRRKQSIARYFIPSIGMFAVAAIAGMMFAQIWLAIAAGIVGFALWGAGEWNYRCPACKRVPAISDGVVFDPTNCPSCGAKLK